MIKYIRAINLCNVINENILYARLVESLIPGTNKKEISHHLSKIWWNRPESNQEISHRNQK